MKKLMIFLMAALVLTGTLLVSCNQNVGEDKLSSVTISEDMARSLSTSTTTNVKPVDQLTWYYKATKMDNGFFVTGQKTEWTELGTGLVGKSLGKMSYGDWKFEFQGRDVNGELSPIVYYCDELLATVNSEETMLTVPLKQGTGFNKARIIFSDLIFTLADVEVSDYVKSNAELFQIDPDIFQNNDIHIHVPEGAVPKDGPSAGVAMTCAIISCLSKRPVSPDVAMTGEVTLRGQALPIGGLREKSLAALRCGIKTIIVPKENKKDVDELPQEVKDNLKIVFMTKVEDAVEICFVK